MTYKYVDSDRLRVAQIVLLSVAVTWGVDYLITPDSAITASLTVVERAMPLPVWGCLFLFFGCMGLLGEVWMEVGRHHPRPHDANIPALRRAENRWWPSYTAHTALLALYAGLGAGYALELFINSHLYGCRAPVLMGAFAVGHWVFMNRRKNVH